MAKHRLVPWTVLVLLVLGVWLFFVHGLAKTQNPSSEEEPHMPSIPVPFHSAPHQLAASAQGQSVASVSNSSVSAEVADFRKKLHDCLPNLKAEGIGNADQLLRQETAGNPVQKTEFEMENTHIELPDGSLRRIHIIPSDQGNSAGIRELRYFKLDGDGLPERIPLTQKQTYNPSPEFVESLKAQGRVVFHQIKQHQWLRDGTQLEINQVDHQVFELQIFEPDKTLSCRAIKCVCQ